MPDTNGGVFYTGTTTIGADTNEDGNGVVELQTRNLTRLQVGNDGFITQNGPLTGSNLAAVVTAIGASQKTLRIATAQTLSADLNIPSNVALEFTDTGSISVASTKRLTVSGPMQAPPRQVFFGSGRVLFGTGAVDTVHASWFGNCATELGAPLNLAINSIKAVGGTIQLPSGELLQTVSVNLSSDAAPAPQNMPIEIIGHGRGTLIASQLTDAAIDCTGSQFIEFWDFSLSGNGSTTPTVGFLLARNNSHDSAGRIHFYNVETQGSFSVAALYNYAAEEVRFENSYFVNDVVGSKAAIITRNNVSGVASPHVTIDSGLQSTTDIRFVGCGLNNYATSGNSDALLMNGASEVSLTNCFKFSNTRSYNHVDASTFGASVAEIFSLTLEVHNLHCV